jgi:diacylglycerol kinase (ATP)
MNLHGLKHVVHATRYSAAGIRVLMREQAARLEIGLLLGSLGLLALFGGRFLDYLVIVLIFCVLFSVEALNTAIECIVDKMSPEKSDFARDTKDLGSAAVFFMLIADGLFLTAVLLRTLGWVNW